MIETKGTLTKSTAENSSHVVTRSISHFCRIQKDSVFANNTSDESDNELEYSRHDKKILITIKITDAIPYVTETPLPIWYCIGTLNILIGNVKYAFHYSRTE